MKTRRKSHKAYGVWEYEREIEDLNQLSEQGWQLEQGGCYSSSFVKDEQVRYIYQLDYAPKIDDKDRYLSFFEEQGWEYINSTFNGWHYFRRPYHENMSEEETEIYTDKQSLVEMQNRYLRGLILISVAYVIIAAAEIMHIITNGIQINRILLTICCLTASAMMGIASCNIKRKQNGQPKICDININVFVLLLVLIFIFLVIL